MKLFLRKSGIFAILFVMANLFFAGAAFGQTLITDEVDYPPGGTATITGSGFTPFEIVKLQVMHADDIPNDGEEHFHWEVTADAAGNFETTWHVCEDDCLGSTLKATADGQVSSLHAEVIFTDSDPVAQALPYSQNFSGLLHSSNTYPAGLVGWKLANGSSGSFRTTTATADHVFNASSDAATNSGGVHNYNGKIGFLSSGSTDASIGLALNTTSSSNISVSFDIMTIRNPFDGSTNTRINQVDVEYRIGITGAFTSISGNVNGIYQNNITQQLTGTTPQNLQSLSFILPAACNNKAVVQIRWVQRDLSGAGTRPGFAIDNVNAANVTLINYVYHEATTNGVGCGSNNFRNILTPNNIQTLTAAWKIEYQFNSTNTALYYTTDGSTPSGSKGVASGSTTALAGSYNCTFGTTVVDVAKATIPVQSAGTVVKYIVGAWNSAGGNELFGNSGNCVGCGAITSSTSATVFNYTVAASPVILTASAGANGSISPNGVTTLASGSNQTYTISANSGYYIADVLVDGSSVGAVSSYTFTNATVNHSISASFVPLINYVYHEASTIGIGCGGNNFRNVLNPDNSQSVTAAWKIEYQNQSNNTTLYYTTDGSSPSGTKGVASGTSIALAGSYNCTFFFASNIDVANATIPAQPAGTIVKYIIGAWNSGGGNEIFANSGATFSPITSSTSANLYTYTVSPTQVDFANVEFPATATINTGGVGVIVYARVFEPGVTLNAGEQSSSITAWIGYSSSNVAPNDPSFTWIPATYNVQVGNDDEYQATIGSTLPAGTYYYASRFQLTGGPYSYGGLGNFWNASSNPSGVLTVNCTTPAARTIASSGATTFCTGGSVILTSSVATGNIWSNGATTPSITVNSSGTYTVSYVDSFGCPSAVSAPVVVTVNPVIAATKVVTPPLCAGGNGTVAVSATGGNGTYTGTGTFTVAAGAPYSFTVTDGFCTSNVISGTMASPTSVVATESHTAIACNGGSSTVTIVATGGTGTYSNGTGTFSQTAGTQSYIVTDSNGCATSVSVTVTEPALLVATTTQTDVNCFGGNTGEIDLTVSGGTAFTSISKSENFDSLASSGGSTSWTNGVTITDWLASVNGSTPANYITGTGSSGTGALYSFGVASTNLVSERALGSVASGGTNNILGAWKITNTTSQTMTSISVSYVGEQWRNGSNTNTQKLVFDYQVDASSISAGTWTTNTTLDFTSLINTSAAATALDGNAPANRSVKTATFPVSVPAGETIWLRWTDVNDSGNDHGLAIDDLSAILTNGSANPYTYAWTGTGVNATAEDQTGLTAGTYNVVVTDKNGCQVSPTAITLVVTDTQIPVITTNGNQNVNNDSNVCGASVLVSASATDNCTVGTPVGVRSDGEQLNAVYPVGPTTITWNVTDSNGNAATPVIQTIVVTDNQIPEISGVGINTTINCPATLSFLSPTASDNCPGVLLAFLDATTNGACAGQYSVTRTWTATDAVGLTATASQTINVQDVDAPVIGALSAPTTINCPATPVFDVASATDACGSAFTLTSNDVTTNGACAGSYSVTRTWTATDACGNESTASQTINVQDVDAPVIGTLTAPTTINCPATPVFDVASAIDACGSTFTLTSNDVTTNGACAGQYSVTRTWTATDSCGNASTASQTINVQDVDAPVIGTLTAPTTINCPATPVFDVATAIDACGSTFTLTSNDVTTNGACAGQYSVTRTWTATDSCGNASTASQTINVQDVDAPVIGTLTASTTINCPATPVFDVASATDACGSVFTLTSNDVTTSGACAGQYSVTRIWTATDACGNVSTASQTINVQDVDAPVIGTLTAPTTINCPATPVFDVASATDACGSVFTLTSNDVTTSGACAGQYSVTRTWTATDACGNASTASQTINVQDVDAPVIGTLSAPTTINCPATPVFDVASAIDACGSTFTLISNDVTTNGACAGSYSVTRTWTATDACGNESTASQTINVQDVDAPVIGTLTAPTTINCPATPVFDVASAIDACGSAFTLTSNDVTTTVSPGNYSVTRTWTATDDCGNESTASQTINVQDVDAPVANVASLATVTGECSASVTAPTASDTCAGLITATTLNPTSYTAQGTYTVTWTYNDGNGNTSTQNQTVIVKDITAPTIVCPANIILSACQATATWATPTGSDNCSGFTVTQIAGPISGSTFANASTTTITYKITDVGGNTATCSFTVIRQAALTLAVTNSNPQLYYGYTLDQSTTIKGTPSGGVGPYKVVITMNRVLACNVLNSAGDETWTASAGGSSTGNTCPGSGPGLIPVSTNLTVPVGGFYSVTSILLSNATFTVTVTDANGCIVSGTTTVYSEDARCFAGNTNIVKVKICHKTGNSKDPCHELCVGESAVAAHIAHGDYIGACLANCVDPVVHTKHIEVEEATKVFKVIGYPNPSKNQFTVDVLSDSNEKVEVAVYDMLARLVRRFESSSKSSPIRFGEDLPSGEYLTVVKQGENIKVLNLIKQ